MTLRERIERLMVEWRERVIELPEAVGLTPAALLNEIADDLADALVAEGQDAKRIPGEDAWLDEFVLCQGARDKLRTALRAYRANLLTKTAEGEQKYMAF